MSRTKLQLMMTAATQVIHFAKCLLQGAPSFLTLALEYKVHGHHLQCVILSVCMQQLLCRCVCVMRRALEEDTKDHVSGI